MRLTRLILWTAVLCGLTLAARDVRTRSFIGVLSPVLAAQQPSYELSVRAGAPLTILQINDVYSTVPVNGLGGLARVATLKKQIAAAGGTPLLVIAGDFLSSSVASIVFKGEQMVAALNAAGLDMATLGNHEFDFGADLLRQRMAEARWQWVVSNVIDRSTGRPIGNAAPYVIRTFGTMKVGFIGLCLTSEGVRADLLEKIRIVPPLEAAATYLTVLQREQVDAIVAITHLSYAEDRALAERFPEIDVIVGGHEHSPITAIENRTLISKAGSEAKLVARIDVRSRGAHRVERHVELIPMTAAIADDPETARVVGDYESRLGLELDTVIGTTNVPLDTVARRIRSAESAAGNLVADAVRASAQSDIAIVNAGGVRGDRVIPPGPLTRRTLLEMHPFGNVVCTIAVTGRVVRQMLEHAFSRLPNAAGQFPLVSGITVVVDPSSPPGQRVREIRVGERTLDQLRTYTLAVPDFLLAGGDSYIMLEGERRVVGPEAGESIASALEKYVSTRSPVAPEVQGRITMTR